MNRKLLMVIGICIGAAALLLPFVGLQRFEGDLEPVLIAFVALAVAIGCLVAHFRPTLFEPYVEGAAAVFLVLALVSMVGVLAQTPPSAYTAAGLHLPF